VLSWLRQRAHHRYCRTPSCLPLVEHGLMRRWLYRQLPGQPDGGFDLRVHRPPCLRQHQLFQVQQHPELLLLSGPGLVHEAHAKVLFGLAAGRYQIEEACQCHTFTKLGL